MPSLADAFSNGFAAKKKAQEESSRKEFQKESETILPPVPGQAPSDSQSTRAQPSTVAIGKAVSGEALDALSTISVLNMSCEGNVLAQELLKKIDHHLREIVKAGEGERHWPEKYKAYCKEEEAGPSVTAAGLSSEEDSSDGASPPTESETTETPREPPALSTPSTSFRDGLSNFDMQEEEEEEEDDDPWSGGYKKGAAKLLSGQLGKGKSTKEKPKKGQQSDVDIYNVLSAEVKDTTGHKKGLAVGQALSYSLKTSLFNETSGNKSTKHPPAVFTETKDTNQTIQGVTFSFQEHAPRIFLHIRETFGINNESFIKSMSELKGGQVGEGKSGMIFFSTADKEYIIKTVTPTEMKFLGRELKSYYDYMIVNGSTSLLPRFLGLYFLKLPDKPIIRLIVMNNVFKLPMGRTLEIVEMYDLKGSLHTRYVGDEERFTGKVSVLKDLNFCNRHDGTDSHGRELRAQEGPCRAMYLGPIRKIELIANLESDAEWLRQHNIMDYSLLLGVAFEISADGTGGQIPEDPEPPQEGWTSAWSADLGGVRGMNGDFSPRSEIYYLGVIDILQEYNMRKKAEHAIKSISNDSTKISAVDPDFYARRFLNWMEAHVA